jgi:hypothetical protein
VNAVFTNNRALTAPSFLGGALYGDSASTLDIRDASFVSNTATFGGSVFAEFTSAVSVSGSTFQRSTASFGGAVYVDSATVGGSTFQRSTAVNGGAVFATTAVTVRESTFVSNTADFGGAIQTGYTSITGSTFLSNTAVQGGAVFAAGPATIENATIAANTAPSGGGAVYFGTSLVLTNATVLANGTATFSSTTATRPLTLIDSIVAGPGSPLCAYPGTLQGVNVIQGTSCGTLGLINAAPLPGSPAIGVAAFCLPTHQRGAVRSAPCDVGAYETGVHPTLTALAPLAATALDQGVTLTVTGTNFLVGTVVLWNGSPRATGVVRSTVLTAAIPASDLEMAGVVTITARYGLAADGLSNGLPFTVSKHSQTITFAGLPDRTIVDPPFGITATASSGLEVTFSASGACSVAGSQVTLTGVGSCTITGQQAGDAVFLAATPVSRTFAVTKGSQTITFAPLADRTVGDPPFIITATASSGLAVVFNASGACTVAGSLVTLTGVGSCTITASQPGEATYNPAAPVGQTFAVRPATVYLPGVFNQHGIG